MYRAWCMCHELITTALEYNRQETFTVFRWLHIQVNYELITMHCSQLFVTSRHIK
jgi:hypothetical protein